MDSTLATLLPTAIGVALSPAALIQLILVMFSHRRVVNSVAFIITLVVMTAVVLAIGAAGGRAAGNESSGPSPIVAWIILGLGAILLLMGVQNWRKRADTSEPAAFAAISKMGPLPVAFLAFGATAVNPKNTVLLLAAGQAVGVSAWPFLNGIGFIVVATLPYTVAVGYALLGGKAAERRLDGMRAWLIEYNRLIMGVVCTLLGLLLVARAAQALL